MSERFINRELSWLEFNQRVLEEAEDPTVPLPEHARIFHFRNDGVPECLLASADWMPRNLDRRVEIVFSHPRPLAPATGSRHPRHPARGHREGPHPPG